MRTRHFCGMLAAGAALTMIWFLYMVMMALGVV